MVGGIEVIDVLKNLRLALVKEPLFYFTLNSIRVTYHEGYEYICEVCGIVLWTKEKKAQVICPKCGRILQFESGISISTDGLHISEGWLRFEKHLLIVLKHELLHWLLNHPIRMEKFLKRYINIPPASLRLLVNMVEDAKVNYILEKSGECLPADFVDYEYVSRVYGVNISEKDIEVCSVEEIVRRILERAGCGSSKMCCMDVGSHEKVLGDEKVAEGVIIQDFRDELKESYEKMCKGELTLDEFEDIIQKVAVENYVKAKAAGYGEGKLLLSLEKFIIPKVDVEWWLKLYNAVNSEIMKTVVQDWTKESRRVPSCFPGIRVIKKPRVFVAVDVSGSVVSDERLYEKFVGTMLKIAYSSDVYVIFWDTKHTEAKKVKNHEDLKKKFSILYGGGGTCFSCLSDVLSSLKKDDILIVLSDGLWIENEEKVVELLKTCRAKKILVYSTKAHKGFDFTVRIKEEKENA